MTKRRRHNGAFKAKGALEAISGAWTVNEIASEHGAHPVQITQWRQVVLESLPQVFVVLPINSPAVTHKIATSHTCKSL